jgi:hypothetical protein
MTVRELPIGYEWPGMVEDTHARYYLEPEAAHRATPLFMVMKMDGEGIHTLAQRCYLRDAVNIVDALRVWYSKEIGWNP